MGHVQRYQTTECPSLIWGAASLENIEIDLRAGFLAEFIFVRTGVGPEESELSGDLTKNGREFMATEQRPDPQGSFDFLLEIDGTVRASFQEVSGLDFEVDSESHP